MNCFSQTYILKSHAFHIRDFAWFSNIGKKEVRMYFKTKTNCNFSYLKSQFCWGYLEYFKKNSKFEIPWIHFPYHITLVLPWDYIAIMTFLTFFIFFILMYPSQFGTCYRMFKRDVNISQWVQKTLWIRISILVWTLSLVLL